MFPEMVDEAGIDEKVLHECLAPDDEESTDSGTEAIGDGPLLCPTEEGAELLEELEDALQNAADEIKDEDDLKELECKAKKESLEYQITSLEQALQGTKTRLADLDQQIAKLDSSSLTFFFGGTSGTRENLTNLQSSEIELKAQQTNQLNAMRQSLSSTNCDDIPAYKALWDTPESRAADKKFLDDMASSDAFLQTQQKFLEAGQTACVVGATVATGGAGGAAASATNMLLASTGSGTAIGIITEAAEGWSSVAHGNSVGDAASKAARDSLYHSYEAATTAVGMITGQGATKFLQSPKGIPRWLGPPDSKVKVVLFDVLAKGGGGATGAGIPAVPQLVPKVITGELSPGEALGQLGMNMGFGGLGGATSSQSGVKDLASNLLVSALAMKLTGSGEFTADRLAEEGPGALMSWLVGRVSANPSPKCQKLSSEIKDIQNKLPTGKQSGGSQPPKVGGETDTTAKKTEADLKPGKPASEMPSPHATEQDVAKLSKMLRDLGIADSSGTSDAQALAKTLGSDVVNSWTKINDLMKSEKGPPFLDKLSSADNDDARRTLKEEFCKENDIDTRTNFAFKLLEKIQGIYGYERGGADKRLQIALKESASDLAKAAEGLAEFNNYPVVLGLDTAPGAMPLKEASKELKGAYFKDFELLGLTKGPQDNWRSTFSDLMDDSMKSGRPVKFVVDGIDFNSEAWKDGTGRFTKTELDVLVNMQNQPGFFENIKFGSMKENENGSRSWSELSPDEAQKFLKDAKDGLKQFPAISYDD